SEGDETIFIEGRKSPLMDITALWHALEIDKADRIMHVAKSLGLTVNKDPLSHVAFGSIQVEDYERFRTSSKAVNFLIYLTKLKVAVERSLTDEVY
nr:aminoacyl-tRNA synthetase, class 1a, anticodon-binding [Tanacetum cinerariifolium]